MRIVQINGGQVSREQGWRLTLPPTAGGYADAQIDDYGRLSHRAHYPWHPGTRMSLRARFSPGQETLRGTAGFGFWNAPFGDPTVRRPALPQAAWFFFGSPPTDLPLALSGPGQGWFAATLDAAGPGALALLPLAPLVLLANQVAGLRATLWPRLRRALCTSCQPLAESMEEWHNYELLWRRQGCRFRVDGRVVHETLAGPRGPMGFVCWIDNQYLIATNRGRLRWGVLNTAVTQTLEVADLRLGPA